MKYLICYDIGDQRRRMRVHKLLRRYGEAVEESVFEVELGETKAQRLVGELQKQADAQEDIVRVYELCQRCVGRVRVLVGPQPAARPVAYVI